MTVYQQIAKNKRRTILLMMVFIALFLTLGFVWGESVSGGGGYSGVISASVVSIVLVFFSYFGGSSVALFSSGAKEIEREDNPYLWRIVENLAITSGLPMPKVYIIDDPVMNAFATGRNPENAAVAFTTGIINGLENEELEAVAAHELSHIQNYDTRLMMIVVVLVGAIAIMGDLFWRVRYFGGNSDNRGGNQAQIIFLVVGIVLSILSPIAAELIKLAISRRREYLADAGSVIKTRYADAMITALEKIAAQGGEMKRASTATAHMFLVNPFSGKRLYSKWFSTHPPVEDRIAALRQMGGNGAE